MKIGVDIGGSHVGIGLMNNTGKIISKEEQDMISPTKEKLVNTIIEMINKILEKEKIDITKIELIGIAVPGTVSNTHIIKADNLHIQNFDITSEINKYFNLPIVLRNDAKCAAVAEKEYGSLKKVKDAVFLTIGTGIGGAVFLDGKLLHPQKYEGFEIGHMVIEKNGLKCNCGRYGCFERYASMRALKEKIKKEYNTELEDKDVQELIKTESKTEKMQVVLDEYIDNLSLGVANLINIFEPETISIGGSFVFYKDILLDKLTKRLMEDNMIFNRQQIPDIVVAKLKNDAGIVGSVIID